MTSPGSLRDAFTETLRARAGLDATAPADSLPEAPAHLVARHTDRHQYVCDDGHQLRLTRHVMGQGCFGKVVSALWVPPPGAGAPVLVAVKKPKRTRFCPPMVDSHGMLHRPTKDTPAFARAAKLCVENLEHEARAAHAQRAALTPLAVLRTRGKALLLLPHMATTVQDFGAALPADLLEPLAWHLLPQLLAQLEAAAAHGANGDIKAGNTLMRGHRVALCDFGWATGDAAKGYGTGAQRFRAPEAFDPALRVPGALPRADVYSLGLLALIVATGNFGRALEKLLARAVHSDRTEHDGMDSAAATRAMGAWMLGAPPAAGPRHALEKRHLRRVLRLCFARLSPALGGLLRRMLHPHPGARVDASTALAAARASAPPALPARLSELLDDHARQSAVAIARAVASLDPAPSAL